MDDDLPDAIPAATLILIRPAAAGGPPEILMLERSETMAFAAGALVFPGGRIDPEDHVLAEGFPGIGDAAARIAAIRETIEETGVAPALRPAPDASALREAMAAGRPFAALLDEMDLALDPGALTPFARWCPNFREARRFDTLFYLAEAPAGGGTLHSADETESVHTFWASAETVLAEIEAGRAKAIFPTRRNLERLARFGSLEEARNDAERYPVRQITPWVEDRGDRRFVCIPEGIGYPVTSEPYESARRR
ncbi:MAG: NUDIX domain-containing protein [Allosphingosinicella sp.]